MKKETVKHKEAFEQYYQMGDQRDLRSLSAELGLSDRTLFNWSKKYNWQNRVQKRDEKVAGKYEEITEQQYLKLKQDEFKGCEMLIEGALVKIENKTLEVKSVNDFDKLIHVLDILMHGNVSERLTELEKRIQQIQEMFEQELHKKETDVQCTELRLTGTG